MRKFLLGMSLLFICNVGAHAAVSCNTFSAGTDKSGNKITLCDLVQTYEDVTALQSEVGRLSAEVQRLRGSMTPVGLIAAFPNGCPGGWEPYYPAAGRFVVGAGRHSADAGESGSNLDRNGVPLETYKSAGEIQEELLIDPRRVHGANWNSIGGSETVALKADGMPPHAHGVGTLKVSDAPLFLHETNLGIALKTGGTKWSLFTPGKDNNGPANTGTHSHGISGSTGTFGPGNAHDNMPPYIALYFCKKE